MNPCACHYREFLNEVDHILWHNSSLHAAPALGIFLRIERNHVDPVTPSKHDFSRELIASVHSTGLINHRYHLKALLLLQCRERNPLLGVLDQPDHVPGGARHALSVETDHTVGELVLVPLIPAPEVGLERPELLLGVVAHYELLHCHFGGPLRGDGAGPPPLTDGVPGRICPGVIPLTVQRQIVDERGTAGDHIIEGDQPGIRKLVGRAHGLQPRRHVVVVSGGGSGLQPAFARCFLSSHSNSHGLLRELGVAPVPNTLEVWN